ncbi:hypothetical protein A2U01_0073555, partial [Trifolium medium]|nr:hypothetical protein [Trifolium medium]
TEVEALKAKIGDALDIVGKSVQQKIEGKGMIKELAAGIKSFEEEMIAEDEKKRLEEEEQ